MLVRRIFFILSFLILHSSANAANSGKVSVQGHRGARALRPENTLAAFKYALEIGVDVLELDIAITEDLVPVISHEPNLNPTLCTTSGPTPVDPKVTIHSLPLSDIKKLDCGTLKNPKFERQQPAPGEKIPTLEELFKMVTESPLLTARTVQFNIETKIVPRQDQATPSPEVFVESILKVVNKFKLLPRVTLQSFDYRTLKIAKAREPELRTVALVMGSMHDPAALAKSLGVFAYSPNVDWINQTEVENLHKAGVQVIPWTANSPDEWDYLIRIGVDGIISDDPAALIQYLKERKLR